MKKIAVIGAGRSSSSLIKYLLDHSSIYEYQITVADQSLAAAEEKINNHPNGKAVHFSIDQSNLRRQIVQDSDIVISMLPAFMHPIIAKDCLEFGKHLVTASYISDEMKSFDEEAKAKGLIFMNECGLDPGIDHMSAMKVIDEIREKGGKMLLFESFCGGLVAPEYDNNLWNYKFTWNPRNVVLAGQGGAAKFIQEGNYKYIPYHKLFRRTEFFEVEGYGRFEGYANRDSLKYRSIYGLDDILTLYRGTIRRVGFSRAWNMFVQLGMTDDSYVIEGSETMSYRDFINAFLPFNLTDSVELKTRYQLGIDQDDIQWEKLEELDIFNPNKIVGLKNATPAQILEKILSESWQLAPEDKDMIVMYHKFGYELNGEKKQIDAKMVTLGEDQAHTAMAKTVGLPVGIVSLQILNGKIKTPGVQLPISKEVYMPVLAELAQQGIQFTEETVPYLGY